MAQYHIFLLPLIALALVIFFPIFGKDSSRSRSGRSRRHRRIFLGRIAVAVLLIATMLTTLWPIENMNSLVQGLIISAAMMLPFCLGVWILNLRSPNKRHSYNAWQFSDSDHELERESSKFSIDLSTVNRQSSTTPTADTTLSSSKKSRRATNRNSAVSRPAAVYDTVNAEANQPLKTESSSTPLRHSEHVARPADHGQHSSEIRHSSSLVQSVDLDASSSASQHTMDKPHPTESRPPSNPLHQKTNIVQPAEIKPDPAQVHENTSTTQSVDSHSSPSHVNSAAQVATPAPSNKKMHRHAHTTHHAASEPLKTQTRPSTPVSSKHDASTMSDHTTLVVNPDDTHAEANEHLRRVSDLVQSHDLDELPFTSPEAAAEKPREKSRKRRDRRFADSAALAATTALPTDLAKLDNNEIAQLVSSLRKDKNRLQKLVIAQQASIESERQAHDQTRILTRDAINIMRGARTAQKSAEKLARRERTERKRIEQQYKKVAHALTNAMSIVESRLAEQSTDDITPSVGSVESA